MHIAYHDLYAHPLPEGHRFPMLKYELIPAQLIHEGIIGTHNLFSPNPCSSELVLLAHTQEYFDKLVSQKLTEKEQRAIGFPQSKELIMRELIITQGTIDCALSALKNGVALNVAGGTHHAFSDRGEGFCLINDMAVAAHYLRFKKLLSRVLIIDLDVHQGNGTAKIFENEEHVFTFSMHGAHNYPFRKELSDLDIGLEVGTKDDLYLDTLEKALDHILDDFKPEFAFYLAGVDVLETDKFGKLSMTLSGCKQRDLVVFSRLKNRGIPCAVALGGGYSPDINIITEAHCNTFRLAKEMFELY